MTKQFYPKLDPTRAAHVLHLSRSDSTRYINLVTGHNELAYFASLSDESVYSGCSFCNTSDETFFHLATDCPSFHQSRLDIFNTDLPLEDENWKVKDLIRFSLLTPIDSILNP